MVEMRNSYRILVRNPEVKRPVGRPRCRWDDDKIDLQQIGWSNMDWIYVAEVRNQWRAIVDTVMNLRFLQNVVKFLNSRATVGFSRRSRLHGVGWSVNALQS
jgi:hypothetical protein